MLLINFHTDALDWLLVSETSQLVSRLFVKDDLNPEKGVADLGLSTHISMSGLLEFQPRYPYIQTSGEIETNLRSSCSFGLE